MSSGTNKDNAPTVVFIHPDLGIGGAERLVIDAAVGLQRRGFHVVVFTSHRDPAHCFDEARDGTLDVRVRGGWLVPRSLLGRLTILCAILRQAHLLLHVALSRELAGLRPTYFFVDQLSAGLPLLQYLSPGARILFYCHFPDLLLAHGRTPDVGGGGSDGTKKGGGSGGGSGGGGGDGGDSNRSGGDSSRSGYTSEGTGAGTGASAFPRASASASRAPGSNLSLLARLYRTPFDALEAWSMGFATAVAVNSAFTRSVVEAVWPFLSANVDLRVVYPCVAPGVAEAPLGAGQDVHSMWEGDRVVLSINRFERKKDVGLAIRAFAAIPADRRKNARLLIAGGYDPRVQENIAYHKELEALADRLDLGHQTHKTLPSALAAPPAPSAPVLFLHSVPTASKLLLLRRASLLVYTPANEHFGIVPLEAMAAGLPVLAATSGGPTETVVDGRTGWLRDTADPGAWAEVLGRVVSGDVPDAELAAMGRAGAARVRGGFERAAMAERLEGVLRAMDDVRRPPPWLNGALNLVGIALVFALGLATSQLFFAAKKWHRGGQ